VSSTRKEGRSSWRLTGNKKARGYRIGGSRSADHTAWSRILSLSQFRSYVFCEAILNLCRNCSCKSQNGKQGSSIFLPVILPPEPGRSSHRHPGKLPGGSVPYSEDTRAFAKSYQSLCNVDIFSVGSPTQRRQWSSRKVAPSPNDRNFEQRSEASGCEAPGAGCADLRSACPGKELL
jgi:hypothetical protein